MPNATAIAPPAVESIASPVRFISVDSKGLTVRRRLGDRRQPELSRDYRFENGYLMLDDPDDIAWMRDHAARTVDVVEDRGTSLLKCFIKARNNQECGFNTYDEDTMRRHTRRWHDG